MFTFVIFSFAIAFQIAFFDVFRYRDLLNAMLGLLQMLFGDNDLINVTRSNRVFGRIYYASFVILCSMILINMFIAVISETYVKLFHEHDRFWERHMTSRVIEYLYPQEKKQTSSWDLLWWITRRIKRTFYHSSLYQTIALRNKRPKQNSADLIELGSTSDESSPANQSFANKVSLAATKNKDQLSYTANDIEDITIEFYKRRNVCVVCPFSIC